MLGDVYLEGLAVPRDEDAALRWFVFAGDRGHRGARSRAFALTQPGHGRGDGAEAATRTGARMSIANRASSSE